VAPTLAPLPAIATAGDSSSADSSAASAPVSLASLLSGEGLALLESLLPAYIAPRRWFGGKSRSIREVHVVSSLPLDDAAVLLVEVGFGEGESELYQLPLAVAAEDDSLVANLREHSPQSVIATLSHTKPPVVLYDASANPAFQAALLRAITGEPGEAPGVADLKATHSSALDASRLSGVPSRLSSAEQSNTSILYGEHAILKLFRHIRTGENPDVEISRFLTEVAHFPAIPAYLGDLALSSDGTTLAFLQAFAPNQGDGWAWTLDELARFYETVVNLPAPTPPNPSSRRERAARSGEPPAFGTTASPSPAIIQHAAFYLDAANLLGRRTAEMHLALATSTAGLQPDIVSAFAAEPYDALSLAEERERIEQSAAAALNALEAALNNAASPLPPESAALANRLLLQRDALTARLHALQGDPAGFGSRIRIHGDYHLGQLLRAASSDQPGFLIVDFEGEPARSLAERRRKQSPLRDVAGMVRSFSYAARSALDRYVQRHPDCRATLLPWAAAWESSVAATFLRGYANSIAISPGLLPAPEQADILLQSLVLEKAIYELLYELNNRPAWLPIPLLGLLAILEV
jgi:maltose alpha-D-glucosyltransferase/alpha-amylase